MAPEGLGARQVRDPRLVALAGDNFALAPVASLGEPGQPDGLLGAPVVPGGSGAEPPPRYLPPVVACSYRSSTWLL